MKTLALVRTTVNTAHQVDSERERERERAPEIESDNWREDGRWRSEVRVQRSAGEQSGSSTVGSKTGSCAEQEVMI